MHIVDTSGQSCPAPLIATKRAIKDDKTGDVFKVITDSLTSLGNISRFLKDNRISFSTQESDGKWTLTITKSGAELILPDAESYCEIVIPHLTRGEFVVAFTSDRMGDGDESLGKLLIGNFINAIKDLDYLPAKMVFYNRGVFLGLNDISSSSGLAELERMGVILLFCATCVDHYSVRERLQIGHLSNMFEIAQAMASASNVIKP